MLTARTIIIGGLCALPVIGFAVAAFIDAWMNEEDD